MPRLLWLTPALLAACASAPPPAAVVDQSGGICRNTGLALFAGRPATAEVGKEILRVSGARALRWVRPGMMVTMEYREDRVTVWLMASPNIERVGSLSSNVIDRVSCG
jgi:hypothetical protein